MIDERITDDRATLAVFTATVFLSASLLFVIQPMVGKMILPHLGGSSSVWTTCMLFFQTSLLAGYAYAHLLADRVPPARQFATHLAIMVLAAALSLPLDVSAGLLDSSNHPAAWLLLALTASIGLPMFVVSSSAPLFQRWFSQTDHPDAGDPYHLYAASNVGSLVALFGYPFLVEPFSTLEMQSSLWSIGFVGLIGLTVVCRSAMASTEEWEGRGDDQSVPAPSWRRRLWWVWITFLPSSLMLGVTDFITTDLASVPLLWVPPLGLYLLSFVLVFARNPVRLPDWMRTIFPALTFAVLVVSLTDLPLYITISAHLGLFFLLALHFHGELAEDRPETPNLTEFFIWMSLGGALGGLFNALVAPVIFDRTLEYLGGLAVALASIRPNADRIDDPFQPTWVAPAAYAPLALVYLYWIEYLELGDTWTMGVSAAAVVAATALALWQPRLENVALAGVFLLGSTSFMTIPGIVDYERSFFGSYSIYDRRHDGRRFRSFSHGTTNHGVQALGGDLKQTPLGYHHPKGPVGQILEAVPHDRVAVAGLGTGAMAAYAGPGAHFDFLEIDPAVERIAREHFTYLDQCGRHCDVHIGDARQLLEQRPDGTYDIIFMDAYNSDSVPTHLLTREALQLYLDKLDRDGVVVFHVSNRYLDVEGVVGSLAKSMGLIARTQLHH
ncbi:MAG: spermidine synthase, partial [Bradymonadaceae bacterium]